ncbi:MAG: hypothetical protein RLZZ403_1346 [Pseudomonadota bacterium]
MSLMELAQSLQDTEFAIALSSSGYIYPLIEGTHVLSLALAVGTILWIDLRLAGFILRGQSFTRLYAASMPVILVGFASMLVTGVLLFVARAADVWGSGYFRVKLILLFLCLGNVLVYHFIVNRDVAAWDTDAVPPLRARLAGLASLVLWFSVVAVGRLMAYNI